MAACVCGATLALAHRGALHCASQRALLVLLMCVHTPPAASSAAAAARAGIVFAGVHDSFWTHAGSVPLMNVVLRDKFVLLHNNTVRGRQC